MEIPNLDLWEKYILTHARCQPQKGALIEVPLSICKVMMLPCDTQSGDTVSIDHSTYWHAIYSQGHVSNLILLYAIGGREYDNVRYDLTLCHLNYILENEPSFADWRDADWIRNFFNTEKDLYKILPLMIKWLKPATSEEQFVRYQQILPLYLYLGDYTKFPKQRVEQRHCLNCLMSGRFIMGDTTWQGVYYDISRSRIWYKLMVQRADSMIAEDNSKMQKRFDFLSFIGFRRKNNNSAICHKVGNWLAFCAYITLLSKYQRYALPVEGLQDAKAFVGAEVTRYYQKLREYIG